MRPRAELVDGGLELWSVGWRLGIRGDTRPGRSRGCQAGFLTDHGEEASESGAPSTEPERRPKHRTPDIGHSVRDTLWRVGGFNKGSLVAADGKLIIFGERGNLALAEASPEEYREISQFQLFNSLTWIAPSLANGRLYVRDEAELVCLDLRK